MKITKYGHSCLLVEVDGVRILTDPGVYSHGQKDVQNLDAVLITHVHDDHCDTGSLKIILEHNPNAVVYTIPEVGEVLEPLNISFQILERGGSVDVRGVSVEGFGEDHAVIYPGNRIFRNTGYLIAGRLFHAGDAFTVPTKPVEILALPTGGPWNKTSLSIDLAMAVKPKVAFPVHDGMFKDTKNGGAWQEKELPKGGIIWKHVADGETVEF